jgi:metallophosphoesterase (TIGR00282 family)
MRILHIGDIVGRAGRNLLRTFVPQLKEELKLDIVAANVENAANGFGITEALYKDIVSYGVDLMSTGNHVFDVKNSENFIDNFDMLTRPANYPEGTAGKGYVTVEKNGVKFTLLNLMGRVFMPLSDCPFRKFDAIYPEIKDSFILVDFHAEATSEKNAFGLYADGRAGAVCGTHTHVQTNDDRIMPKGTLYISDVGMCGGLDTVIGMSPNEPIERFLGALPRKFEVEKSGRMIFNAIFFEFGEGNVITDYSKISVISGE